MQRSVARPVHDPATSRPGAGGGGALDPKRHDAGNTFFVLGEVKKLGAYQLDEGTSVLQAIAMAGGFSDKAAPNRTKIIRTHRDGRQETLQVDLNEVMKRGRREQDLPLLSNDVVMVPESFF